MARGAMLLSQRAGLERQTQFVIGRGEALPFRAAWVTHVWIGDDLAARPAPERLLGEMLRVLRPGGALSAAMPARRESAAVGYWLDRLRATGFVGVQCRELLPVEVPHSLLTALAHLEAFVARHHSVDGARFKSLVRSTRAELQSLAPVVQFFAERPS
jgi:SAM-dependent methyltransferase